MSRIGKKTVAIPAGVEVKVGGLRDLTVKGPKGTLGLTLRPEVDVTIDGNEATVSANGTGSGRQSRAFHGMTRALLSNMVDGVTKGFERKLEIQGVGWNAQSGGNKITLNIGYCHPVVIDMPDGVTCESPSPTTIILKGTDKQAVGHTAAVIRAARPPEPYKGKGIRYEGEYVRRKSGKSFGS